MNETLKRAAELLRQDCLREVGSDEVSQVATKLEALAAQMGEPVSHQYQSRDGKWREFIDDKHYRDTADSMAWPIRALYAAPQPAQPIQVPAKMTQSDIGVGVDVVDHAQNVAFAEGWNACRHAMLAAIAKATGCAETAPNNAKLRDALRAPDLSADLGAGG